MGIQLSSEIKALLDRPNFVHLATLMADGSPQSVPVWVGREGDHILICTGEGSLKARNTLRDPRVALSVVDFRDRTRRRGCVGVWSNGVRIPSCATWIRSRISTRGNRFRFASRRAEWRW